MDRDSPEHDGLELNRFERNTSHLAPRTLRGGPTSGSFTKIAKTTPCKVRIPGIAALVLHGSEKKMARRQAPPDPIVLYRAPIEPMVAVPELDARNFHPSPVLFRPKARVQAFPGAIPRCRSSRGGMCMICTPLVHLVH
jgi:hypothetical protein